MRNWKRWGAWLLVLAMTATLTPLATLAAPAEPVFDDSAVVEDAPLPAEPPEEAWETAPAQGEQAALSAEAGMKDQTENGLTVSFVQYTGYKGFGSDRTEVQKDDLTLVAAKVTWTAVTGATGYTVTVTSADDTRTFTNTGNDSCVWQQDNTARTARITNLYPGKTYTVTVTAQGAAASGSMTFTTKTATNALAEIAAADGEAPAAWGAIPDDNQLKYHDDELAAFIHYGPNTFNNRSWGTGTESPADFAPTALNQDVVDGWVKQFQDAGFQRLIFVAKHHDGFCLWFSQYTDHDLEAENSGYKYDLLEQVSKACTKYDMDMGFYISPWDAYETPGSHNPDGVYGTDAYNELYLNTLREVLDSKANGNKYGNNGKFVEVWMDGAKGSNVQQSNDFDTWFQLIHELQPECAIFSPRADGGIRWVGNEGGYSGSNEDKTDKGDISWQKVDPKNQNVSDTLTPNICDPHENPRFPRQYGKPDGVLWSVNECDVSIESEWFWHAGNTLKTMDALATMYFETVGYGSPFLLNVPPSTTGSFDSDASQRLAEFGREVQNSFRSDMAQGKTASAGATRASATDGKFAAANVVDNDPDNYWTMDDAAWTAWKNSASKAPGAAGSASITVDLGSTKTFDVISVQEFIPLGQRIISGMAEYHDASGWHEFGAFHTVGAKRLIRSTPVSGDQIRVTITDAYAVPVIRSVGVYKMTKALSLGSGVPAGLTFIDDRDSAVTYSGTKTQYDNGDGLSNTHTGLNNTTSSVTVTFTGSKFYVMGIVDPGHGPVEVVIDGGDPVTFETHADTRATKQVLYASPDLAQGQHTIVMKAKTGTYGSTTKTFFDFDGIYYLNNGGKGMLEFEYPAYTVLPNSTVDLKVKRVGGSTGEVSFQFSDQPGTAIQGDYVQMGATYTMADGETEKIITMRTTGGAVSGGSPIGKNFYGVLADPVGAILGFNTQAEITIQNPDNTAQTPAGGTFTPAEVFYFPGKVNQANRLEAEHMAMDGSAADAGKEIRVQTDSNASGGKKLGWFEPNNKATLYYYAPVAGVYTMTFRYESGRTAGNLNKVNWRGAKVEDRSTDIPGTMDGGSVTFGVASFDLTVNEAGYGALEFYADAQASPNIDYINFELKTSFGGVTSVTLDRDEVTLYLNGAQGEESTQLVATVLPADAENSTPVWRSSNPDVAYVRQDGTVGARSNGTAVITASAGDEGMQKEASATVTVKTRVTGDVVISGAPKYNAALVASVNQISHQGAKAGLTYQWKRDGAAISGATGNTYTVSAADIGHALTVTVTATGDYVGTTTSVPVTGTKADGPEVVASLDFTDCTAAGNDGKITGLNANRAYEYKSTDAADWADVPGTPGATQLTGLAPGSYHVRVKETATHAAGPVSRTLTILSAGAAGNSIAIGALANGRITANVRRAASGATITLTAYPAAGYQLKVGSVKVTGLSGNVAVTNDTTFTMPGEDVSVTAEFVIRSYTISHELKNIMCSMGQGDHVVDHNEKPVITLTPVEGYELPQTVTVRRTEDQSAFSDYTYRNGKITFTRGIDADLEIIGAAVAKTYTVTYEITHLSATQAPRSVSHGEALTFQIQPADELYTLPQTIQVVVNGKALAASDYTYSAEGTVTVAAAKITGNVVIRAEGVRETEALESISVSGTAKMGRQLTATVVPAAATVVYQWVRVSEDGTRVNIPGATYAHYMLTAEDVGKTIVAEATGTGGYGGKVTSQPTEAVEDSPLQPVSGVTLDVTKAGIGVGKTLQLTATVAPENATNKTVRWMSSNEFVASVNDSGVVTGLAEGEAIITVITNNGARTAQCAVTVGGVMLDRSALSLKVNEKATLTATILAELTNKRVLWSSSDVAVAVVDETGAVTALAAGTAVITATTAEGSFTADCAVTVTASTSGGGSSGGSSGGSGGSGGGTGTKPVTPDDDKKPTTPDGGVTNPDGSVTYPDGSVTIVGTDRRTGTVTRITTQADGRKAVQTTTKEGTAIVVTGPEGETLAEVSIPAVLPRRETAFADVPEGHWAQAAVEAMAGLDLMRGVGSDLYDPVSPVTRGSLATILYRLSNGKTDYVGTFRDVKAGKYYAEGVTWAAQTGVVTGFSADVFAPEQTITREQLAVMFARYAKLVGLRTDADVKALDAFPDGGSTGGWAAQGVAWCVENGILKGKGKDGLDPTASVTRGEVAVMLERFISLLR